MISRINWMLLLIASDFLPVFAAPSDTISSIVVAPGVIHTQYVLPGPFTLDVLEVDAGNPYIRLESYRPNGLTKTSVQSAANDREGHRVIGAVNADFFSFETGWPINNQVVNGKPVQGVGSNRSHLAVVGDKRPFIEQFSLNGKAFASSGISATINGINTGRGTGDLVLYTSFRGSNTGTDGTGVECSLSLLSPAWIANDTTVFVVTAKQSGGNTAIPSNGAVLSAGSSNTFLSTVSANDTVKLFIGFSPTSIRAITQLIGGAGRILKDGANVSTNSASAEGLGLDFVTARHPRTFFGFTADTSKIYLCTVDGRQTSSLGMSFNEMANFLTSIGITDAFNLDGGGSTTMVVRGKVVNSPSDPAGERSVANSLQVISTAPTGTLTFLNIIEERADVFQGNTFQFHAEGKDQFYNPLPLPAGTVWSADTGIGTINSTGFFTAKSANDSGWIRLRYGSASDSAHVYVRVVKELRVYPQALVMVPGERLTLMIRGIDSGNNKVDLLNTQVQYINNASKLDVDPNGVVTSTGFGSGSITVRLDTVTRHVLYNSSGTDTTIAVDEFGDTFHWSWDVQNTDPDNVTFGLSSDTLAANPPTFKIGYGFPPPSCTVLLNTNLPLSGRVDSIFFRVHGDGGGHSFRLFFNDKEGQTFVISSPVTVTWKDEWRTVGFRLVNAIPAAGGTVDFPLTLSRIEITVGTLNQIGGKAVGTIYLDDIKAHYPNRAVTPIVLYDFNSGVTGWLQPYGVGSGQTVGIKRDGSRLEYSTEHPYEGSGSGKWTFIDSAEISVDWSIRIARTTTAELGSMLRGSYIGAWIWANGQTNLTLRTVIRDGNGLICQGPPFPVNHIGWKLIGPRLDAGLFTPYLTSGKITDANNRFNGFRVEGTHAALSGQTRILYIDKMVTSALTVPTGFIGFNAIWDSLGRKVNLNWSVNSEISVDRYPAERSSDGINFSEIAIVTAIGNIDTTHHYSFSDVTVNPGETYTYRIRQITNDGAQELSPPISVRITSAGNIAEISPYRYELHQNYPNPFNPSTRIHYSLARQGRVSLKVFDLLGREVAKPVDEFQESGFRSIEFDASHLPSGVYFYRIEAGGFTETRKMIVLR